MQKATAKDLNRFNKNYATDQRTCDRFMQFLNGRLQRTRQTRLQLEEFWLEYLRQWSCRLDDLGFQGRSNLFIAELNNQVESSIEKMVGALFPNSDYLKCIPMRDTDAKTADKIKAAVLYELEIKNKLSSLHWDFERARVLFGNGIYKVGFERTMLDVFLRGKDGKPRKTQVPKWNGVRVSVVDNFKFYVSPELLNIDEADLVFEDRIYNIEQAKRDGIYVGLDQVPEIVHDIDHQWVDASKLELMQISNVLQYYTGCALFTDVFCDFELTNGEVVPVMATIANNRKVVRLIRNPFWFQKHPYLTSKYVARPGNPFYGLSLADKISTQQDMINDLANQTMDSLNFIVNPIAIIDPGLAGDINSMKVMPGARWLGSPEGIQFSQFPDVSGSGFRGMQEIRGQIAQFSDNSPGIAPQLQGKARSATQATIVSQNVSSAQRAKGKVEETEVLAPLAKMTHILLQQFQTEAWQIRVQGPDKGEWITMNVDPKDIVGDVDFAWQGVSESDRTAVRSQQLLAAYNLAMQTATVMPGEVDLPEFFKIVMKEAFDLKEIDLIFNSLKQKKTIEQEIENIALMEGKEVDIHPGDDDEEHIRLLEPLLEEKGLDDNAEYVILRHIEKHKIQMEAKKELEQMKAKVESLKALQMEQEQGGQGGPAVPSPMEGNQSQVASSAQGQFSSAQGSNNIMEMG